ncbi:unnamed protein product [Rhizoctonia solani]|uniref:Uncharacterized protein n=1 Tax=Rhizoctonia solani TaxID=456999 RepID=A0A8H3HUE2_9AGAM|nr:unnamed protein product [Rhizoctonia solani]
MPIAHRRPGLLHLVMPHPALDQTAAPSPPSTVASPHTPRRTPRHLPESLPRPRTSVASDKPRSSIDSWNSVDTNELIWEWKEQELELLSRTLDNIPSHLMTPYVGVIPPPNVLDKLARDIALSRTALEWPHSVRATRVKLNELCRRKPVKKAAERRAAPQPTRTTVEDVPESAPSRRPLYRQSSMDFLPVKNEVTSVTRLSSRLQRADRMVPHATFHPYARPYGSRSPTPPLTDNTISCPRTRSSTPSETSSLRAPSPRRLFRSSATPPPQSLKRAPTFGAATVQTRVQRAQSCAPLDSGPYSSDEEEKVRQACAKRPRTTARRVPSFLGAPLPPLAPSPEEEILDPLVVVPEDPVFAPTIPASKRKPLPTPRRSSAKSTTKPTAQAAAATSTAPAPAPTTTPRTLRRVGTRDFPSTSATTPVRAPAPTTPRVAQAPEQPRRSAGTRTSATQPRTGAAAPASSSNERRDEKKSRREKDKETQTTQDSSRRIKKKSATFNMKDAKPSVTGMRL